MNNNVSFRQQLNDIVIGAVYAEAGCEFDVIDKLVKLIDEELIGFTGSEKNLRQSMRERLMEEVAFRPIRTNDKEREL